MMSEMEDLGLSGTSILRMLHYKQIRWFLNNHCEPWQEPRVSGRDTHVLMDWAELEPQRAAGQN